MTVISLSPTQHSAACLLLDGAMRMADFHAAMTARANTVRGAVGMLVCKGAAELCDGLYRLTAAGKEHLGVVEPAPEAVASGVGAVDAAADEPEILAYINAAAGPVDRRPFRSYTVEINLDAFDGVAWRLTDMMGVDHLAFKLRAIAQSAIKHSGAPVDTIAAVHCLETNVTQNVELRALADMHQSKCVAAKAIDAPQSPQPADSDSDGAVAADSGPRTPDWVDCGAGSREAPADSAAQDFHIWSSDLRTCVDAHSADGLARRLAAAVALWRLHDAEMVHIGRSSPPRTATITVAAVRDDAPAIANLVWRYLISQPISGERTPAARLRISAPGADARLCNARTSAGLSQEIQAFLLTNSTPSGVYIRIARMDAPALAVSLCPEAYWQNHTRGAGGVDCVDAHGSDLGGGGMKALITPAIEGDVFLILRVRHDDPSFSSDTRREIVAAQQALDDRSIAAAAAALRTIADLLDGGADDHH